ncbi:MAG: hypothetical protein L6W00_07510 [Lentisphaeria bacterium]|nr:MAG: hypothetical protein L6W00_07510 [Lentisphaeria bacterium]
MKKLGSLSPAPVWEIFEMICSIPHPSGHEAALAEALAAAARERGLAVRRDAAGNLRIARAAAPGFESAPVVLLQAHLDMVPQTAPGVKFDFLTDPIPPEIRGSGWSPAPEPRSAPTTESASPPRWRSSSTRHGAAGRWQGCSPSPRRWGSTARWRSPRRCWRGPICSISTPKRRVSSTSAVPAVPG